jgi:hypothetical protein
MGVIEEFGCEIEEGRIIGGKEKVIVCGGKTEELKTRLKGNNSEE